VAYSRLFDHFWHYDSDVGEFGLASPSLALPQPAVNAGSKEAPSCGFALAQKQMTELKPVNSGSILPWHCCILYFLSLQSVVSWRKIYSIFIDLK
jgi:hypothetical protein